MKYFAFIAQDKRNGQGKQPPARKASEITKKKKKTKTMYGFEEHRFQWD